MEDAGSARPQLSRDAATEAAASGPPPRAPQEHTALAAGLAGCRECGRVRPLGTPRCPRCGTPFAPPSPASLQAVWAWLAAGVIFYIPANIYPMLLTTLFGRTTENTILGGVIELGRHGNWWVAVVVFVASIVIPIGKFVVIAWLALQVRHAVREGARLDGQQAGARTRLYLIVDFIGRWSMIDVFVVAILAALVQMQFVAAINPGIAAISFCISVVLTMLAAQAFDSRLIWMQPAGPAAPVRAAEALRAAPSGAPAATLVSAPPASEPASEAMR